ncbi:DNA-methyltransferase [Candidatus Hodarchaeum mangrovi]
MEKSDTFDGQTIYYKSSEDMSEIENSSIDTIITSPPYNRSKHYSDDTGTIYNDNKPEKLYFSFLSRVWSECFRVLSPKGVFFLNIGDSAKDQGISEKVVNLAVKVGFIRLQNIIWIKSLLGKGHYTPTGGTRRLNNLWENIYVLIKDKKEYNINPLNIGIPYADKTNIGRYNKEDLRDAGNIWFIPYQKTTGVSIKKGHEAPFPIELPYRCIKLTEANIILDPFLGTGSTLAAARYLNKKGIGYEKYPRKDIIQNRILKEEFRPEPPILIPHIVLTVQFLLNVIKDYQQLVPIKFSKFLSTKKEEEQIKIVREVLKNLTLSWSQLDEFLNLSKENNKKISHVPLSELLNEKKI